MPKFYAVHAGRQPGVFQSWSDCEKSVSGFSGAVFKSFTTSAAARAFVAGGPSAPLPPGDCRPPIPKTVRGFGSAGTRTADQAAAALAAAKALLRGFSQDAVVAFTDGACTGNPGPCGAGAAVFTPLPDGASGDRLSGEPDLAGFLDLGVTGTNNVGELSAVGLALTLIDAARQRGVVCRRVEILTDSAYVRGSLVSDWKSKANAKLISSLRARLAAYAAEGINVRVHWVAGHVGLPGNERADALANLGVQAGLRSEAVLDWKHFGTTRFGSGPEADAAEDALRGAVGRKKAQGDVVQRACVKRVRIDPSSEQPVAKKARKHTSTRGK